MGSKRVMLENGLGELLAAQVKSDSRVVDLFSGAASVSWFAATKLKKPVLACDLQKYAAVLAGSVVKRTKPIKTQDLDKSWLSCADRASSRVGNRLATLIQPNTLLRHGTSVPRSYVPRMRQQSPY